MKPTAIHQQLVEIHNRRGAPPKLTPERHATIIRCIRECSFPETAAAMAGVTISTVRNWWIRGKRDEGTPEEKAFSEEFTKALADAEHQLVLKIRADPDVSAAKYLLGKRFRERWGDHQKVDVTSGGKPLAAPVTNVQVNIAATIDVRRMSLEDLQQLDAVARKYAALATPALPGPGSAPEGRATVAAALRADAGAPTPR